MKLSLALAQTAMHIHPRVLVVSLCLYPKMKQFLLLGTGNHSG